ncbi:MAG: hypothetical protein QOG63_1904 [Thermoleophilaceae bacterium]|nr:hypothetical protein [Thermoleophilaceae bacterium]
MAARRESQRLRRAARGRSGAEEEASAASEEEHRGEENDEPDREQSESGGGIFSELKDVASDAALAVLAPVAKQAATTAAKFAVKKGPELMESKVLPKLAEAGGPGGLLESLKDGGGPVSGLLSKVAGGDDGDGERGVGDGTGKGRRMPIQQAVDVAAPIDIVYDEFTQFEDWPKFMHRVERVEQKDDATVTFHEKVWGFRRQWEAEIVEQRPDERIVWESVSGMEHVGAVTFHELAERLTRVELNIDIDPSGPIEKIARGARFAKRAARADLKRFKAWVEMREDDDVDGWRGEIEDGEVVDYEEPEAEAEQEEPEEYDEPEAEAEPEEEPEPEEEKPRRQQSRSRGGSSRQSSGSRSRGSSNGSSKAKSGGSTRSRSSSKSSNGTSKSGGSTRSRSSSKSSNGSSKSGGGTRKSRAKSSSGSR